MEFKVVAKRYHLKTMKSHHTASFCLGTTLLSYIKPLFISFLNHLIITDSYASQHILLHWSKKVSKLQYVDSMYKRPMAQFNLSGFELLSEITEFEGDMVGSEHVDENHGEFDQGLALLF